MNVKIYTHTMRNEELGINQFKGYVNRSFNTTSIRIDDSFIGSRIHFGLGVHYKESAGIVLVEVKYLLSKHQMRWFDKNTKWKVIPKEVWDKFFKMYLDDEYAGQYCCLDICRDMANAITATAPYKSLCFKCKYDESQRGGLSKWVENCLPVLFIREWQVKFSTFVKYHNVISNPKELNALVAAMEDISGVSYNIKHNVSEGRKEEFMDRIASHQSEIEANTRELERICSEGADAMNELSDKFGIELDLSQDCPGNPFFNKDNDLTWIGER